MANLIHLFKVGQEVRCNMDGTFYKGTVKETPARSAIDVPVDEMLIVELYSK